MERKTNKILEKHKKIKTKKLKQKPATVIRTIIANTIITVKPCSNRKLQ